MVGRSGGGVDGGEREWAVGRLGTGIVCGSSSEYRVNSCVNFGPFSGPELFFAHASHQTHVFFQKSTHG